MYNSIRLPNLWAGLSFIALTVAISSQSAQAQTVASVEPSTSSSAKADATNTVGDIVVTADRRETALSKVALSVSAYSNVTMDRQSVRNIDDLTRITPGITFTRGFGNTSSIAIRGVTSSGAGTTGIYIDDIPIQTRSVGVGAYNTYPLIFDLDRVEVLRGPQGTLFGSGSEGGAVRFLTPKPSLTSYSAYARGELSFTENGNPSYEAGLAVGGPILKDKIGFRVSGWYQHGGGWVDQISPTTHQFENNDINKNDSYAFKSDIRFALTDSLTVTTSFYAQKQHLFDNGQYWEQFSDARNGQFNSGITTPQPSTDRFYLPSIKIEYEGPGFQVISNTSYFDRREESVYDYSTLIPAYYVLQSFNPAFPNYPAYANIRNKQKNLTQEVRIQSDKPESPLKWIFGGFYGRSTQGNSENIVDTQFNSIIPYVYHQTVQQRFGEPVLDGNRIYISRDDATDEQIAGFGEVSYTLFKTLTLTAGGRYAASSFTLTDDVNGPFNGGLHTSVNGTTHDNTFNPKFGLSWQADSDSLYYITVSKGFRPGGVNAQIPYTEGICMQDQIRNGGKAPSAYLSDSIWSYEAGIKKQLFDRKLSVNGSVYYLDWSNIQQGRSACGLSYIDNSGQAESKGFDLQATWKPTHSITLGGSASYVDAHYTKAITGGLTSAGIPSTTIGVGDALVVQPWNIMVDAEYEFEIFRRSGYIQADYELHTGDKRTPALDPKTTMYTANALLLQPTNFVTVRTGVRFSNWDLSFFVKNLTNDSTPIGRFYDRATIGGLFKDVSFRPRTFGLTMVGRY